MTANTAKNQQPIIGSTPSRIKQQAVRLLIVASLLFPCIAQAAVPPLIITTEANYQQTQELTPMSLQQGSSLNLWCIMTSKTGYPDLGGTTALWEGRSNAVSTQALQVASSLTYTNSFPHRYEFELDSTETGTAVTNWVWSLIILDDVTPYVMGEGDFDIDESAWTGAGFVLTNTTTQAAIDASIALHAAVVATSNTLGHVIVGDGINVDSNGVISAASAALTLQDVTDNGATTTNALTLSGGVNMATSTISQIKSLKFDIANTDSPDVGEVIWSNTEGTLEIGMVGGEVIQQVGFELYVKARNQTGVTITNGSAVYISGGFGDQVLMSLANASDPETYALLGLATEDVLHAATGHICIEGEVRGLDTSAWPVGTKLYLSTTSGMLTSTIPPSATDAIIKVCIVKRQHANEGILLVHDITPFTLAEDFNGSLRYTLRNTSTGTTAIAAFTAMNDGNRRSSFGISGTANLIGSNGGFMYSEGYGKTGFFNDGPVDFGWYISNTTTGQLAFVSNEVMTLSLTGLSISNNLSVGETISMSAGTTVDEFSTDGTLSGNSDDALPTEKAVKTYAATAEQGGHADMVVPLIDGLSSNRASIEITSDGATITATIDAEDLSGTLIYYFDHNAISYAMPTNIILNAGTSSIIQDNYLVANPDGSITAHTTNPQTERAVIATCGLLDASSTQTHGKPVYQQRWTEMVDGLHERGRVSHLGESIRLGQGWRSGMDTALVIVDTNPDDVYLTVEAGVMRQLHQQVTAEVTTNSPIYYILNDTNGITVISNLNEIDHDADGDPALDSNNRRFGVDVILYTMSGSTNYDSNVFLTLSTGDYGSDSTALNDSSGFRAAKIPPEMKGGSVLLGTAILRKQSGGNDWSNSIIRDRRGEQLNISGSSSGVASQSTVFNTDVFRINDPIDETKQIALDASAISTATTRTISMPDENVDLSLVGSAVQVELDPSNAVHVVDTGNPHSVTASQIGLGNVDNTSDANKPLSIATTNALAGKLDNTGTANTVLYIDSSGDVTELALGTVGQVLTSDSPTTAPTFETPSGGGVSQPINVGAWTYIPGAGLTANSSVGSTVNSVAGSGYHRFGRGLTSAETSLQDSEYNLTFVPPTDGANTSKIYFYATSDAATDCKFIIYMYDNDGTQLYTGTDQDAVAADTLESVDIEYTTSASIVFVRVIAYSKDSEVVYFNRWEP